MKYVAIIFLVIVAASVLSAPNPFHFFGGNHHRLPGTQWRSSKKPGKPDKPDKEDTATGPKPITLPFAAGLNVPFYVPTRYSPHTTTPVIAPANTVISASHPVLPIYSTIPIAAQTPKNIPFVSERRGVSLALDSLPVATPLPTVFARGHPAFPLDVEPVAEAKEPTRVP